MALSPCPSCGKQKWATQTTYPNNVRQQMLHCMECGFEVDARVARESRHILKRDAGQDLRPAETSQVADGPSD